MPTPTFQPLGGEPTTQQIQDYIIKLIRDLNFLLGNLDTLNVGRLDAKVIISQSIQTDKLAAGAVTADKISVNQLSAISADLGTITAGQIFGNYIATSNGTFPRIELSSTGKLFQAFMDALNYVYISPNETNSPTLTCKDQGGSGLRMFMDSNHSGDGGLNISGGHLFLNSSLGNIKLSTTQNLMINGSAGYTGSFVAGTQTVTVTKGIITSVV